ncbi:hypothetical protein DPMN_168938 [Dreissena polymorpha]|uniref:Uncharacterized protein n=1 Tax=Dreissena polymorpha TaxID=45954 RepID=A0A9D4IWE4_DREPO|nr:hypothetical protein DPMN_168938 [Dreissena polymorpha]
MPDRGNLYMVHCLRSGQAGCPQGIGHSTLPAEFQPGFAVSLQGRRGFRRVIGKFNYNSG